MYVSPNYKSRAALKRGIAAGDVVTIYQTGPYGGNEPRDAKGIAVEGPHFPQAHSWYGTVDVSNGFVTRVR